MKPLPATLLTATLTATVAIVAPSAQAAVIVLQSATATYSQSGFPVGGTIDADSNSGWAVDPNQGQDQTAAFETQADAGFAGGSELTFTLGTHRADSFHNLGRFRLSLTTDDRSAFADGLATSGDVTANWIVLDLASASSANGQTLTEQPDFSLLASGTNPGIDTVTVTALTSLTGITGIRLEMLTDASLPGGGPGRAFNGNFVLTGLSVSITAVPEPAHYAAVAGLALVGFGAWRRCRRLSGGRFFVFAAGR